MIVITNMLYFINPTKILTVVRSNTMIIQTIDMVETDVNCYLNASHSRKIDRESGLLTHLVFCPDYYGQVSTKIRETDE